MLPHVAAMTSNGKSPARPAIVPVLAIKPPTAVRAPLRSLAELRAAKGLSGSSKAPGGAILLPKGLKEQIAGLNVAQRAGVVAYISELGRQEAKQLLPSAVIGHGTAYSELEVEQLPQQAPFWSTWIQRMRSACHSCGQHGGKVPTRNPANSALVIQRNWRSHRRLRLTPTLGAVAEADEEAIAGVEHVAHGTGVVPLAPTGTTPSPSVASKSQAHVPGASPAKSPALASAKASSPMQGAPGLRAISGTATTPDARGSALQATHAKPPGMRGRAAGSSQPMLGMPSSIQQAVQLTSGASPVGSTAAASQPARPGLPSSIRAEPQQAPALRATGSAHAWNQPERPVSLPVSLGLPSSIKSTPQMQR